MKFVSRLQKPSILQLITKFLHDLGPNSRHLRLGNIFANTKGKVNLHPWRHGFYSLNHFNGCNGLIVQHASFTARLDRRSVHTATIAININQVKVPIAFYLLLKSHRKSKPNGKHDHYSAGAYHDPHDSQQGSRSSPQEISDS